MPCLLLHCIRSTMNFWYPLDMKIGEEYLRSVHPIRVAFVFWGTQGMSRECKFHQWCFMPNCVRRCATGQVAAVLIVHTFGGRGSPRK